MAVAVGLGLLKNKKYRYLTLVDREPAKHRGIIPQQPQEIENVFGIAAGETILQTYNTDERCCGCGQNYRVILTDARITQRRKYIMRCCTCNHTDSMFFLSDISSIIDPVDPNCLHLCNPFYLLHFMVGVLCCSNRGKPVGLWGGFGLEIFTFDYRQVKNAIGNNSSSSDAS